MKKIPTVFLRNREDLKTVLPVVTPGCEWVQAGEGVATRKFDGTCCRFDGEMWLARREIKPGKATPANFVPEMTDEATGKTVGWVPMAGSAFEKWHREVLERCPDWPFEVGTYELCGPKINGNPEQYTVHVLVQHANAERLLEVPTDFEGLKDWLSGSDFEGIVWHHPDGRMAKIKVRDFFSGVMRDAA